MLVDDQPPGERVGADHGVELRPDKITGRVQSEHIPAGRVTDLATRRKVDDVDALGGFTVELPAFGGLAMVVR